MRPEEINAAREIAEKQTAHYEQNGEYPENAVCFEFNGVSIHDPFLDETGRFPVDPVEYYGAAFLSSQFVGGARS